MIKKVAKLIAPAPYPEAVCTKHIDIGARTLSLSKAYPAVSVGVIAAAVADEVLNPGLARPAYDVVAARITA